MKILENACFYQLSILLLADLKKFKSIISKELNSTSAEHTLDVCCGTGNIADLVNGKYLGFDLNKNYIAYAGNRFKDDSSKEFLISDINDFAFPPKYFDNVLLISTLHHFNDDSCLELLDKINKTAKKKIIITDPAIETGNPLSRLLILLDRGKFIRSLDRQLNLISRKLNIIKHFTYYMGLAHGRILVCCPKN